MTAGVRLLSPILSIYGCDAESSGRSEPGWEEGKRREEKNR
jgi:hypothetical protein